MAQQEWTSLFQMKTNIFKEGHSWRLQFDESLVPDSLDSGWKQYIRNTCARFKCSSCGRGWPSNRVMVVFHMRLTDEQGHVKVRAFRQNCKMCSEATMETPSITTENINILLDNLVEKIRIKCYHEDLGKTSKPFVSLDVKSPHEPAHCEACLTGICTRN
ncbi:receptor-transporting protein 3-like [Pseudoliparis swirei]|uniref:receptor-transporting protein 3-like n=1 Tax=Pseudoliparis swirei TaxID=2059687 RepID=UPI0024BD9C5B|nr:receptor-transporting protein 3-like [Pseudoliparis swirei]